MNFPEWAPTTLVEYYKARLETPIPNLSPEAQIERLKKEGQLEGFSETQLDSLRRSMYRDMTSLPDEEGNKLLRKLLIDLRMKSAWSSLGRRIKDSDYYFRFWSNCSRGITGWRSIEKMTPKKRKEHFWEVRDTALHLVDLMEKTPEFAHYQTSEVLDKEVIKQLLKLDKDFDYDMTNTYIKKFDAERNIGRYLLPSIVPNIYIILADIAKKAQSYANEEALVKQPNSNAAEIHFFIRNLSPYLLREFDQPLHEVVASTASVVFDTEIDSDMVRKLVK